jgi:peptidoglycan/LPS O-acetylase OafA/YrhL
MTLDPPMWTLAVEAAFYAVLPVLGALALRTRRTRAAQAALPLALIAAGLLFNWRLAGAEIPSILLAKSLPAMLPYFALGMLAAVLVQGRSLPRGAAAALVAGGLALVAADGWLHASAVAGTDLALNLRIVRDLPAAAGFAALVAVAAARPPALLAWRPLAWCGAVSYGLYLWHVPVLLALRGHGLLPASPWLAALVALPVSLLLAWASWRAVERPAIAWARRTRVFGANRAGRAPAPAPAALPAPALSPGAARSARTARARTRSSVRAAPASRP